MEKLNVPEKKNRESSNRWRERTIELFGYALNLILGLSIAGIGYETTLILDKKFQQGCWQNCLLTISLLALFLSVSFALYCVITRLRNFRITAKIAEKREDGETDIVLQPLRTKSKDWDKLTWTLFWWQLGSFAVGILLLVAVIVMGFLDTAI